jgi:hypothetical protein
MPAISRPATGAQARGIDPRPSMTARHFGGSCRPGACAIPQAAADLGPGSAQPVACTPAGALRNSPSRDRTLMGAPAPPAAPPAPPRHLQNPFGAAKPRETVIAAKMGKTEEEVLKEEVSKEKLHVSDQKTRGRPGLPVKARYWWAGCCRRDERSWAAAGGAEAWLQAGNACVGMCSPSGSFSP